jgi:hypothetical protein
MSNEIIKKMQQNIFIMDFQVTKTFGTLILQEFIKFPKMPTVTAARISKNH